MSYLANHPVEQFLYQRGMERAFPCLHPVARVDSITTIRTQEGGGGKRFLILISSVTSTSATEETMAGANTLEFTDQNFDTEIKDSAVPVLVDFWATWCPPCKMLAPIIDEIANDLAGKLKVGKVDTDASPNTRDSFGINSIPTMIVFKGGKEVERLVGFLPKPALMSKLNPYLS
jgi:thioredoxin 1